ncbi:tRNA nucleotidyltransferase (CCA-adding enzyme) [Trichlorobacter thiogenes]|uniref:tRNA nucleotidyltransferase (CCA-adding enzyme) n=1 Tax=Trichlorobacter thiogenes TaxID=115783 RepID=A0A1T4KQ56_9BACT|nr:hypothetical protein [Trichlorobacter thiogenes]SJZ44542.1 tRNA nucleotidyltransferase (CCA-adding enzyme) [Trichlorobacter thiogenes]
MADQAVKSGITEILPLVSAADKPFGSGMAGWEMTVRIVQLNTAELGINQDAMETMPVENWAGFILQKRVDQRRRQI